MQKIFPDDKTQCIPFYISNKNYSTGSRLGGNHPQDIIPEGKRVRYLGTFQITIKPTIEISIFLFFDFSEMYDYSNILFNNDKFVKILSHGKSIRTKNPLIGSDLSPHSIFLSKVSNDFILDDGNKIIHPHHKLGGRPYISDINLINQVKAIEKKGYFQALQLAFPNHNDGEIEGDWPFAGGSFHLFGKEPFDNCVWYYCWEY